MLRTSMMALAALLLAAATALAPATALAGERFGGGWYGGWPQVARFDFYGGRFLLAAHTYEHEYAAFNPSCAWLRRLVATPVGPRWQLVPLCF